MGPIQTLPVGLTGLLNLKSHGRVPDELDSIVGPSVDILPFWLNSRIEVLDSATYTKTVGPTGISVQSFTTAIQVPANEWWWVHDYAVEARFTAAAGQSVDNFQAILWLNQNAPAAYAAVGNVVSGVSNAAGTAGLLSSGQGFWAHPGSILGFFVGNIVTAATVAFAGMGRISRLKV